MRFTRTLKRVGYIALMLMAAVAVGITGAAPILPKNRERHIVIELVEIKQEEPVSAVWDEFAQKS